MRKASVFMILAVLLLAVPRGEVRAAPRIQDSGEQVVIVIDPGHGGENEGTIENGFQEKTMTMKTAEAMYEELLKYDNVKVYLTRTEDRDLTLRERAEFAQEVGADFLFSIHYNASPNHNLFGTEVWIPSKPPLNAYGYQFGCIQLENMEDMGLFLRGVKTRLNDKGTDYYGIIREASALDIPAVIIEHCHVDEERDTPYLSGDSGLEAFGRADAASAARYFGLKSEELGVDYSGSADAFAGADRETAVGRTLKDETEPEICLIELAGADYETGKVDLKVAAADYDSMLLYYAYSLDGGLSYSPLQPWPESNALTGRYSDTFTLTLEIPSGTLPTIRLRAYNLFDVFAESSDVDSLQRFDYGEEPAVSGESEAGELQRTEEPKASEETAVWAPAADQKETQGEKSLLTFLKICLICAGALLVLVIILQGFLIRFRRGRRRRR